ncbi:MAG: hypothetical protein ACOY3Y_00970 [Acidobacteriota bacterium]
MRVTRDVVRDLLPAYFSGEASADTRAAVDEFFSAEPELAELWRREWSAHPRATVPLPPPDLEIATLRRARRVLGLERWLLGAAILFSSVGFTVRFDVPASGEVVSRFLFLDRPLELISLLGVAAALWVAYFAVRRRTRSTVI